MNVSEDVYTEIINVTPEKARDWLELNERNRTLRKSHVSYLAEEMKAGRWQFSGDAIRFNNEGELVDGQHRLHACIQAGTSFTTLVVYGLNGRIFDVLDSGTPRTNADRIRLEGIKHAKSCAVITRNLARFIADGDGTVRRTPKTYGAPQKVSGSMTMELIERFPDIIESAAIASEFNNAGIFPRPAYLCFLMFLFRFADFEAAEDFRDQLITGSGLAAKHPALTLRNWCAKMKAQTGAGGKSEMRQEVYAGYWAGAWRAFCQGREYASAQAMRGPVRIYRLNYNRLLDQATRP